MKKFRPAFSALILAALLPLAFAQTPTAAPAKKIDASAPIAKADANGVINPNFQKSHESFLARGKAGPIDVLFLGDSITAGWANPARAHIWESFYGKNQPANFGIGGDQTQHVIWRIENGELDGIKPKVTVLMLGTNNTGHRYGTETAAETAEGVRAILDTLTTRVPGARILLLGIFPRAEAIKRQRNDEVNRQIEKLADDKRVFWLNLGEHFFESDGTLQKRLFLDEKPFPIHLSTEGYKTWAAAMQPRIKELISKQE